MFACCTREHTYKSAEWFGFFGVFLQGHVAAVRTVAEVERVRQELLNDSKIARATHNILAYRIEYAPGKFSQDCDDDGETAAGARVLHLLQLTNTVNAAVVVSRWCGVVVWGFVCVFFCIGLARRIRKYRTNAFTV
jgi:hypothetical protein